MSIRQSRIVLCGVVAAVLLFGSLALAQADSNKPCCKDPNTPWHKDPNAPRPDMAAIMKEKLGLSDEQAAQMQQLMTANMEKMKAAGQAIQEKRKALNAAVESGAGEEAIRAAAADLGKALGDAAVLRAENLAEVKKILTAEQFQKWQAAKAGFAERAKGMRGMRGPGMLGKGMPTEATSEAEQPKGPWEPRGDRGRMGPPNPEKIFEMKDTNGDGKLTLEEFTADGRGTDEHFKKADTDGDGFLTLEEFTESIKQFMGRHHGPQ